MKLFKPSNMSRESFAKLVPGGQVRSACLFFFKCLTENNTLFPLLTRATFLRTLQDDAQPFWSIRLRIDQGKTLQNKYARTHRLVYATLATIIFDEAGRRWPAAHNKDETQTRLDALPHASTSTPKASGNSIYPSFNPHLQTAHGINATNHFLASFQ